MNATEREQMLRRRVLAIEETHALADQLAAKGISHQRDLWGHDVSHAWEWWKRQVRFHIERSLLR